MAAPAQKYQVVLGGYNQCDGGEAGPCECDAQGVCIGRPGGTPANPLPAFFDYPAAHQIDVVFDGCAFGCPGSEGNGSAPPGG